MSEATWELAEKVKGSVSMYLNNGLEQSLSQPSEQELNLP